MKIFQNNLELMNNFDNNFHNFGKLWKKHNWNVLNIFLGNSKALLGILILVISQLSAVNIFHYCIFD